MIEFRPDADTALLHKHTGKIDRLKNVYGQKTFQSVLNDTMHDADKDKRKAPIDKKLMDTCVEMESIFVARMLKEMRKNVHKTEWLHGGFAEEIFEDMLFDNYSTIISKNSSMGLADMLYKELSLKA